MENKYFKRVDAEGVYFYKTDKEGPEDNDFDRTFRGVYICFHREGNIEISRETFHIFEETYEEISKEEFYAFLEFATSIINEDND